MPIPKEILAVARPKNTVVHAYGKNKVSAHGEAIIGAKRPEAYAVPARG